VKGDVDTTKFLRAVQMRNARIAASLTATRRSGPGTMHSAREFFCTIDLARFGADKKSAFRKELDAATEALRRALPKDNWGLARKLMNIFLRDALYTTYLCEHFGLKVAEKFLEIPLDSITSKHLRKRAGRGVLPAWKGVKHLNSEASEKYQKFAGEHAENRGIARVHLDTYWWGERTS